MVEKEEENIINEESVQNLINANELIFNEVYEKEIGLLF